MTKTGGVPNARPDSEEAIGLVVTGRVGNPVPAQNGAAAVVASSARRRAGSLNDQWHDMLGEVFAGRTWVA